MAEDGDWYSRGMYLEGHPQSKFHREHFGHPSEYGYKELCRDWKIDLWDPEDLMRLYQKMGARYFLALGNHHDNFDCWDSKYQPWNAVNIGPHQDIVGIWEKVARKHDMPFGIGFHNTPARTWGQFMPVRYTSDKQGDKAGVPYDAMLTKADGYRPNADGTDKWWKGMDPQDLYGPVHHDGRKSLESPFANQFMWRVDDAIRKYQPDMIYFDDHAGDSQIDLGIDMGLGKLTPQIIANFYNIADKRPSGRKEVVATFKGVGLTSTRKRSIAHVHLLNGVMTTYLYSSGRPYLCPHPAPLSRPLRSASTLKPIRICRKNHKRGVGGE